MSEEGKDETYAEGLSGHDGTRPGIPYPDYESTAIILSQMGVPENFSSSGNVRYSQRQLPGMDLYFVANRTDRLVNETCRFRTQLGHPRLWDPLTGEIRPLPQYEQKKGVASIVMRFDAFQSFFVIFTEGAPESGKEPVPSENFPPLVTQTELTGSWIVSFDIKWGGPESIVFDQLEDWTGRPEEGIRYYSGIASYHKDFEFKMDKENQNHKRIYLDLGEVHDLAGIVLNNKNLGEVWTKPWQIDVTDALIDGENHLEIRVANRWPNRMIGDEFMPYDGVSDGELPAWLTGGEKRSSGRYTFTTLSCYTKDSPLLPSGLMGPVTLKIIE
jgi:hypothetical protein